MAVDIKWAMAPDELQGAAAQKAAQGGLLYVFPGRQLGVPTIEIGSAEMDDEREIDIVECHVHVRNDTVDTIHVTWVLEPEGGVPAKYWQWFSCVPGKSAKLTNPAGASGFLSANPDLDATRWVPRGRAVEDVVSVIDEHTSAYSTMLATELATTMTYAETRGGPARPRDRRGVPLGWAFAEENIGGVEVQFRGSDAVWVYGAPVARAGTYPVASCALWMSPNQPWGCQVGYQLTDTLPIDVVHYFSFDNTGRANRNGESLSADGSAAPAGAAAASAALWSASDGIAAAAVAKVRAV